MKAAVLEHPSPIEKSPLRILEVPQPVPDVGQVLLKVRACGVCRTDLHIVEGELPQKYPSIIPGHQIVADVIASASSNAQVGSRVGVSWIGGTDGTCPYCLAGNENLCDQPIYTGYTTNGGYAEYTVARADFLIPLPTALDDLHAAPLLCAGIIGYRSLRIADVRPKQKVGLFGFGSAAHLAIKVLQAWDCRVYVSTRQSEHQALAREMGAHWVGGATDLPPEQLDCAITFAPSGDVVIAALKSIRKGGIVAINAIHLDRIPSFDYDSILWGERQLRSVTNMTRTDAKEFLKLADEIHLTPSVRPFALDQANQALASIKQDAVRGAAVIIL